MKISVFTFKVEAKIELNKYPWILKESAFVKKTYRRHFPAQKYPKFYSFNRKFHVNRKFVYLKKKEFTSAITHRKTLFRAHHRIHFAKN